MFLTRLTKTVAGAAAAIAIGGGAYGLVSATASTAPSAAAEATSPAAGSGRRTPGIQGSNARSGPAAGGAAGTVASVSTASLTISTAAGQKVTVNEAPSTRYRAGAGSTSATAIKKGYSVLVLGTTIGTTITASQVIVQPSGGGRSPTSPAAAAVPFQRGAPSTSKHVGQIPASYRQGTGTIVSGMTANTATEAALAAYPGGIVDRVVTLGNGEYEVHNIGVSWPHHIFVSQDFKVVGAD
jgi:hypothetical protein